MAGYVSYRLITTCLPSLLCECE
uniref:Uncharacterized protein n=1 Tax=Anguilla anguilla TaxID=7936 RepID=A0A0E9R3S4_ANGAN